MHLLMINTPWCMKWKNLYNGASCGLKGYNILFATLIWPIDFIIPDTFNDIVEQKASLFLVMPKVFQELVQVSSVRGLLLKQFKNLRLEFTPTRGEWWKETAKINVDGFYLRFELLFLILFLNLCNLITLFLSLFVVTLEAWSFT